MYVNIWDKKGDGSFSYELPFTVKKKDVLKIENKGLSYSKAYLYNETLKEVVHSKNINSSHVFTLALEQVNGLSQKKGRVFPVFSINIEDSKGRKVISNKNVLRSYEQHGVEVNNLKAGRLTTRITFSKGKFSNPYRLKAKLFDMNSSKEINISGDLILN